MNSKKLSSLVVLMTLSSCALSCIFTPPSKGMLLKAEVEHSESLPAIDGALQPGMVFDANRASQIAAKPTNLWYRIPDWLAGDWHKETQTNYFRFDYRTGTENRKPSMIAAKSNGSWGVQKDLAGSIWHYDPAPFVSNIDAGDDWVIQMVRSSEPIEVSSDRFVRRSIDTQVRVDKETRRIKAVESGEQLTIYTPEGDGVIKRDTSSKVFDQNGKALVMGKSLCYETRTADFSPKEFFAGKNVRALFVEFMQDLGLQS